MAALSAAGIEEIRRRDPVQHGAVALQQRVHAAVFLGFQIDPEVGPDLADV
jgi:hypothetical protein